MYEGVNVPIWLPIGLFLIGFLSIILEIFIPAGGLIGIVGAGCLVATVIMVFISYHWAWGAVTLGTIFLLLPVLYLIGVRYFSKSFFGKFFILRHEQKNKEGYTSFMQERYANIEGKEGVAHTDLRPSGTAVIDGKKYSVVTSGEYVSKGETVRVLLAEGSRVIVRSFK